MAFFQSRREQWQDSILICEDISAGVVPMGAEMRAWQEIVMKRKYVQAMMTGMTAMLAVTVPVTTVAAATPEKEQTYQG